MLVYPDDIKEFMHADVFVVSESSEDIIYEGGVLGYDANRERWYIWTGRGFNDRRYLKKFDIIYLDCGDGRMEPIGGVFPEESRTH